MAIGQRKKSLLRQLKKIGMASEKLYQNTLIKVVPRNIIDHSHSKSIKYSLKP